MNLRRWWEPSNLFPAVGVAAAAVVLLRVSTLVSARRQAARLRSEVAALGAPPPAARSGAGAPSDVMIQGLLGDDARQSGVPRLLNVGGAGGSPDGPVTVEWEADGGASLRFLSRLQSRLGRCEKLDITSAEPPLLHVTTAFERRLFPLEAAAAGGRNGAVPPARNVFAPLWKPRQENVALVQARELKKQEEERKAEQAQMEKDRAAREEEQQLAGKRQQLETELALTGIVNDGHQPLAFVSNRSSGGQATMLRSGDMINDARVTSIDEAKGQVALDYRGKFQVLLKIP